MILLKLLTGYYKNSRPHHTLRSSQRYKFSRQWHTWKRNKSRRLLRHWKVYKRKTRQQCQEWHRTYHFYSFCKTTILRPSVMWTSPSAMTDTMQRLLSIRVIVCSWKMISGGRRSTIFRRLVLKRIVLRPCIIWDMLTRSWTCLWRRFRRWKRFRLLSRCHKCCSRLRILMKLLAGLNRRLSGIRLYWRRFLMILGFWQELEAFSSG